MAKADESEFWLRVTDALQAAGKEHSQMGVARLLKMSQGSIQRWVRGTGLPTMDNALILAKKAGVCVEWLLTGRGPRAPLGGLTREEEVLLSRFRKLTPDNRRNVLGWVALQRAMQFTGDTSARDEFQRQIAVEDAELKAAQERSQSKGGHHAR